MRPQKSLDEEVLSGLTTVFRYKGYEGATLQELASATGLKKASLYHRFPNGKKEMAEAVFSHLNQWVQKNIFHALRNSQESPHDRLQKALDQIRMLYNGGEQPCIFRALSMQVGISLFAKQIAAGMHEWLEAWGQIGLDFHLTQEQANSCAMQTLIDLQGCLIVANGLNDPTIFDRTLEKIKNRYTQ